MSRRIQVFLAVVFFLYQGLVYGAIEESIGYVVAINGEATVVHANGNSEVLARRSPIGVGDRIVTAADAWLQLRFADSAILSLSCNSSLLVREYQYLDQNDDRSQLHLESGRARTITGTIQRSNYRFTAQQISIRPSGTDFEVLIDEENQYYFGVYDGAIRISSAVGELIIGANQPAQYARLDPDSGLTATPLRPAQFGNGVLGGIECP